MGRSGEAGLGLWFGPYASAPLAFSNTSLALNGSCAAVAAAASPLAAPWSRDPLTRLASLQGGCALAEFVAPPELPTAGISARMGQVAFPWGCGQVPLPDGPSLYLLSHEGRGVVVIVSGEALERSA